MRKTVCHIGLAGLLLVRKCPNGGLLAAVTKGRQIQGSGDIHQSVVNNTEITASPGDDNVALTSSPPSCTISGSTFNVRLPAFVA